MKKPVEKIGPERIVASGCIIQLVNQDVKIGEKEMTFEHARRAPGVRLIITKEDQILLMKEYRNELEDYDYRIPGGKVFDRVEDYEQFLASGEDMMSVARAKVIEEGQEEVGILPKEFTYLATSHCGAIVQWDLIYFVVTEFEELPAPTTDDPLEQASSIEWFSRDKVKEMCLDGSIKEDRTVAQLLKFLQ